MVHSGAGVVLCATDGVFGYVRTPGEVECVLLQTLQASSDPVSWGERLVDRISGYTGDDATLAVAAISYKDFKSLRSGLAARAADVDAEQHLPFANVDPSDHDTDHVDPGRDLEQVSDRLHHAHAWWWARESEVAVNKGAVMHVIVTVV